MDPAPRVMGAAVCLGGNVASNERGPVHVGGGGLIGLTVGLHFMCGYLAFLGVFVLGLCAEGRLVARLARYGRAFCRFPGGGGVGHRARSS